MKILIVGVGSVGKRHLENLIYLGFQDISLVKRDKKSYSKFKVFSTISKACYKRSFDCAIIATPTTIHFQNFKDLANFNVPNIYIEKPIATNLKDAKKIESIAINKKINVSVGYDLHFDLGLAKLKELIDNKIIGKTLTFQVEVGQYLPDWRPQEDYRKGMSAKKNLGGGVMLDLIHEFDYVNWIFGPIDSIFGKNNHSSDLEIETEDNSLNIVQTKKGIFGSIYLDYLQKELSRTCKIVGNKGTIVWNYKEATVKWMTHENPIWHKFEYKNFDRNDRFIAIIKTFMSSSLNDKDVRLSNIKDAIESLKIVECAKKSNLENKLIKI